MRNLPSAVPAHIGRTKEMSRMARLREEDLLKALQGVKDPDRGGDLVGLGMISGLSLKDGHVSFAIEVDPQRGPRLEPLRQAAEQAVRALPGVRSVSAVLTAQRPPQPETPHAHGHHGHGHGPAAIEAPLLPEVKAIIAIASGKGGVGKSTTAVNLALALRDMGLSVGMFDADIFGPSQPRLLGVAGAQPVSEDGKTIAPVEAYGLKVMSLGFLVPEDSPVIWRGPMVMGALEQMLRDVRWGALDVLVVDMPPGTGDTQLTMTQKVPLTGAVIVSTPQDIALLDARKGLAMFRKVNVPVLGLIENMSTFHCPHCGHETPIFGHGGARLEAARLSTDFLGEIPLDITIRQLSDDGKPIVASQPDSPHAQAYRAIAAKIWDKVTTLQSARP
jgi:ATP-binding protein involved in chromosome partitioning